MPIYSYFLWQHTAMIVEHSSNWPNLIISYDKIMEDTTSQVTRIATWLNLSLNRRALDDYADNFLCENLRHSKNKKVDLINSTEVPDLIKEFYCKIEEYSGKENKLRSIKELISYQHWAKDLETISELYNAFKQSEGNMLQGKIIEMQNTIESLEKRSSYLRTR